MTLKRALPFMYLKPNKATKPTIAVEISFFLSFFFYMGFLIGQHLYKILIDNVLYA
jgi:hypothetical protein